MNGTRGFTLLEILVAITVISILGGVAFYALTSQSRMGVRSTEMMKGIAFAKQKMDSLKVTGYGDLSSGSDTVGERYLRSWQVTAMKDDLGAPNGRKKIELSVHWPLTAEHGVALATLVSDESFREAP